MNALTTTIVTIAGGFVAVAITALVLSRNSTTVPLVQTAFAGYGNVLGIALSPNNGGGSVGGMSLNNIANFGASVLPSF